MAIAGIGQCSWDFLLRVARYPEPDTKQEVDSLSEQGGGPVATALVALARLGRACRFHGVVGDDHEGRDIRASLEDEGIDTAGLITQMGAASQTAFITVEPTGRRTIFWRRPTGEALQPDELPSGFLDGAEFLLLDGLMAEVSMHAAREARDRNIPVMLDAGRVRPGMLELARMCDYVVASEEFARETGYDGDSERHLRAMGRDPRGVYTFTLGARGSHTIHGGVVFHTPAFPVEAVDTTGAGDVFHGCYVHGLLKGWALEKTVRFASAMAALKCRGIGGRSAIPSEAEALELLG